MVRALHWRDGLSVEYKHSPAPRWSTPEDSWDYYKRIVIEGDGEQEELFLSGIVELAAKIGHSGTSTPVAHTELRLPLVFDATRGDSNDMSFLCPAFRETG